jgi:hypothetical protein
VVSLIFISFLLVRRTCHISNVSSVTAMTDRDGGM